MLRVTRYKSFFMKLILNNSFSHLCKVDLVLFRFRKVSPKIFISASSLKDCRCNFMRPPMERWRCPIYKGTHGKVAMPDLQRYPWKLCLTKHELEINVFVSLNCLFSFAVSLRKWLSMLMSHLNSPLDW